MSLFPHVQGPKANKGEKFKPEPWQCFYFTTLMGWKKSGTNIRRFSRAYKEVPRGSGKSFESGAFGCVMAFADGETGSEVYSAATTRDQAKIVWKAARRMLVKSPELAEAMGVEVNAHNLYQPSTGSVFIALSAEDKNLDGLNVYLAIIDELHAHPTRGVYDVLETAISKRDQAMLFVITTAGNDRTGICYEIRSDLVRVLEGTATDESLFGAIWSIDEGDDWRAESSWIKANPNWGVSVNPEFIRGLAKKAERIPAAQAAFKTKHLNVWVGANAALFDGDAWTKCADTTLTRDQFVGETCISGLDLATKDDLASRCDLFWKFDDAGVSHLYPFWRHYVPEDKCADGSNDRYPGWMGEGWITATPGDTIDMAAIEGDVLVDSSRFELSPLAFDPWQSAYLAQRLTEQGATMLEVRPTVANFSEATKTLGALIKEGRIHHNGDPVAAWALGNVVGHYDAKENVYPRKEKPENKIDPMIALIMAISVWIRRNDPWAYSRNLADDGLLFLS